MNYILIFNGLSSINEGLWVNILTILGSTEESQKVSEYDQEIPQSHTVDRPTAPRGRAVEHQQQQDLRQLKQSNKLSFPRQDDCKTRKDTKQCIPKTKFNTEPPQTMGGT